MTISRKQMIDRSLELSKTSNEHSRAAGQACLLISGGAATAIIAYLSKDKLDPSLVSKVAWSLIGYGLGVFFAAAMLFYVTQALDDFSQYWLNRAGNRPYKRYFSRGYSWWYAFFGCGLVTFALFVSASIWFAKTLIAAPGSGSAICGLG